MSGWNFDVSAMKRSAAADGDADTPGGLTPISEQPCELHMTTWVCLRDADCCRNQHLLVSLPYLLSARGCNLCQKCSFCCKLLATRCKQPLINCLS